MSAGREVGMCWDDDPAVVDTNPARSTSQYQKEERILAVRR